MLKNQKTIPQRGIFGWVLRERTKHLGDATNLFANSA